MDDDVASLHGVASLPSDSGYTSNASLPRKRHVRKRTVTTTTASASSTGSLNARFDRLSKEMEAVARANEHGAAGSSLGIRKKEFLRTSTGVRVDFDGREGKPVRDGEEGDEENEPALKRRRSLAPSTAVPRSRASASRSDWRGGACEEGDVSTLSLRSVVSPVSGNRRTVVLESRGAIQDAMCDSLGVSMELPSFMRERERSTPSQPRHEQRSPTPDWLARRSGSPQLTAFIPPLRSPTVVQSPYSPFPPVESSPLFTSPPPVHHNPQFAPYFAPEVTQLLYPPHPQESQQAPPPYPFSISGRISRPPSRFEYPQESLYKSQLGQAGPWLNRRDSSSFDRPLPQAPSPQQYFDPRYEEMYYSEPAASTRVYDQQPNFAPEPFYPSPERFHEPQSSSSFTLHQTLAPSPPRQPSAGLSAFRHPSLEPSPVYYEPYHSQPTFAPPQHVEPQQHSTTSEASFWWHRPLPALQTQLQRSSFQPGQLRFAQRLQQEALSQVGEPSDRPRLHRPPPPPPLQRHTAAPSPSNSPRTPRPPTPAPPHPSQPTPPRLPPPQKRTDASPRHIVEETPLGRSRSTSTRRSESGRVRRTEEGRATVLVPDSPPLAGRGGGVPGTGDEAQPVRSDWDVASEGEKLVAVAMGSGTQVDSGGVDSVEGGGIAFWEDQEDCIQE